MKKILSALVLLLVLTSFQTKEAVSTKITFTYTRSYCGGAKPPQELLNELNSPKALSNCKLMVIHENNKAFKGPAGKTNEKGEVLLSFLKKGNYHVYLLSNKGNKAELPFNKKCKQLLKRRLATFSYDGTETQINLQIPCDPCDPSSGRRP